MLRVERLTVGHNVDRFDSGSEEIDEWLRGAALTADRAGTARVYVGVDDRGGVGGFFAIAPHDVRRAEVPSSVGRGSPNLIPGYLLARLATTLPHGNGVGGELLVIALGTILQAIRLGGGRVIVVDAIDDNAVAFYEHFGFRYAAERRLIMKASTAAASLSLDWP